MSRTALDQRQLPKYTKGQERFNEVSHIVGGAMGVVALVLCIVKAALDNNTAGVLTGIVYGLSMIALYTMSSIYHGLVPGRAKKVMQVLDHCTIFILIAGTYTPIAVCGFVPYDPTLGWGILIFEWSVSAIAVVFTAIDLHKYAALSMICMLLTGWAIIPFYQTVINSIGMNGFVLILAGGIVYTLGAILYGIGSKKSIMHCIFHVFVLVGSILTLLAILLYVL